MDDTVIASLIEIINRMDKRVTTLESCSKEVEIRAAITKTELKSIKEQSTETKNQLNELTDSINELTTGITASINTLSNDINIKVMQLEARPFKATVSTMLAIVSPIVTAGLIALVMKFF